MVRRHLLALALLLFAAPALAQPGGYAGPQPYTQSRLLKIGQLLGADFNSVADQTIAITGTTRYYLSYVTVTNCSTSITTAKGGFYAAAGKTNPFFNQATTNVWTGLTAANVAQTTGGTGGATGAFNGGSSFLYTGPSTIFLSLSTAQGSAATCDVYVFGVDLTN